jgi:prepilin-type N-terminal cleavage/methylation domain-containing protein
METKKHSIYLKFGQVFHASFIERAKGFTLIELLVVIAIIGLLASVVLVALNSARTKSRDTKRVSDMNQVIKALEIYYNENNSYPVGTGVFSTSSAPGLNKFLVTMPKSPSPADGGCVDGTPVAEGTNYNAYYYNGSNTTFTITFCLGPTNPGNIGTGIHYLTPGGFK